MDRFNVDETCGGHFEPRKETNWLLMPFEKRVLAHVTHHEDCWVCRWLVGTPAERPKDG